MEAGTDTLVMHLCEERAPENQKFILQEVSELSRPSLLPSVGSRGERGGKALSLAQSWRVLGLPPCVGEGERHCDPEPVAPPLESGVWCQRHFHLPSLWTPLSLSLCLHLELQRRKWGEDLSQTRSKMKWGLNT